LTPAEEVKLAEFKQQNIMIKCTTYRIEMPEIDCLHTRVESLRGNRRCDKDCPYYTIPTKNEIREADMGKSKNSMFDPWGVWSRKKEKKTKTYGKNYIRRQERNREIRDDLEKGCSMVELSHKHKLTKARIGQIAEGY